MISASRSAIVAARVRRREITCRSGSIGHVGARADSSATVAVSGRSCARRSALPCSSRRSAAVAGDARARVRAPATAMASACRPCRTLAAVSASTRKTGMRGPGRAPRQPNRRPRSGIRSMQTGLDALAQARRSVQRACQGLRQFPRRAFAGRRRPAEPVAVRGTAAPVRAQPSGLRRTRRAGRACGRSREERATCPLTPMLPAASSARTRSDPSLPGLRRAACDLDSTRANGLWPAGLLRARLRGRTAAPGARRAPDAVAPETERRSTVDILYAGSHRRRDRRRRGAARAAGRPGSRNRKEH